MVAGIALRAITNPWEYSPAAVDQFREILPELLLKCGSANLRFGRPARAREWVRRSLRERFSVSAALLYALTFGVEIGRGVRLRDCAVTKTRRAAQHVGDAVGGTQRAPDRDDVPRV
jgi:hypothetical protein